MSRRGAALAVLMMAVVAAAGCQAMRGLTPGAAAEDAAIAASVKARLGADPAVDLARVEVDTSRGTVYLNGTVASADLKTRAERLAWQASGVRSVVNNLQVQKP